MAYTPQTWVNNSPSYPLSAVRMTYIENGIKAAHDLVAAVGGAGTIVDATSTQKGAIKIAGDIGGTADIPTVPFAVRTDAVNQTIAGTKTFSSPVVVATPTTNTHATTKTYVDTAVATKASLASPTFTGTPTAPTPTVGDNSTKISTTAFVANTLSAISAPLVLPLDGTTDCTALIQAAIDAAAATATPGMKFQNGSGIFQAGTQANGGGYVTLPAGVFTVTTLTLGHRVWLRGQGKGSVLLQKAATTGPVIQNRRDGSFHAQYCTVSDLTVHGNKASQTSANIGILLQGDETNNFTSLLDEDYDINCTVRDVYVMSTKGTGISMIGAGGNFVDKVKIRGADGIGLYSFQDNHISNVDIGWSGLQGMVIAGESCTVTNCKSWFSGQITTASGNGFYMTADSGAMNACNAQDNTAAGFLWDGAFGWDASGLLSDSNSKNSPGTYPAFDISASNFNKVTGVARNRFNVAATTGAQASALRIRNSSVTNTIDLIGATGVWGTNAAALTQAGSTTTGNTVVINGITQ